MEDEVRLDLDWAYSIQKRYGEKLGWLIAQSASATDGGQNTPHFEALVQLARKWGIEDFERTYIEQIGRQAKLTPLDEPSIRAVYERLFAAIQRIAGNAGAQLNDYIISTLPSGSISALCAANSWEDRKYIFVDSDLTIFGNSLSKALSLCFPYSGKKPSSFDFTARRCVVEAIKNTEFKKRIIDLFAATTLLGHARASQPWLPNSDQLPFAMVFAHFVDLFVLSHEFSHGLLGHLDAAQRLSMSDALLSDAYALIMSHEQEYEADASALFCSVGIALEMQLSPTVAILASYSFLKRIEILEASCAIFGEEVSDLLSTHPRPRDRASRLLEAALQIAPTTDKQLSISAQARRIDQVFYWARQHVLTSLNGMKALGMRPRRKEFQRILNLDKPSILGINPTVPTSNILFLDALRQAASLK